MKIGIDISQIVYGTGVSTYTRNLVTALLKLDQENSYTLFFSSLRRKLDYSFINELTSWRVEIKKIKIPPTALELLWNRLHILPIESFVGQVDIFHASDWTQPPAKQAKLVTTIHDLSFLRWPKSVHPKILAVQKRRLEWVKKEADAIIAVSKATKREIVELLGIPEKKITVIYEALPSDVADFGLTAPSAAKKPYIFAYGSQSPRKNIKKIIAAFKEAKKKFDCQLVICGEYKPEVKLPKDIILAGFLPRQRMLSWLAGATVFAYPSLYEGFGLPILEAFALGVPVVTSNISSMAEVAGQAAILVDPRSTESIAKGIKTGLSSELVRKKLIKEGKERVKKFTWEKAAKETLRVYKRIKS